LLFVEVHKGAQAILRAKMQQETVHLVRKETVRFAVQLLMLLASLRPEQWVFVLVHKVVGVVVRRVSF
jgi:hypothetical protein